MQHAHDQAWQAMSGMTVWYNDSESPSASYQSKGSMEKRGITASQPS